MDPRTNGLALPKLLQQLKNHNQAVRLDAVFALGQLVPPAGKAVLALIDVLSDPAVHVRKMAAIALGDLGRDTPGAVPALVNTVLHDQAASVRRRAAVTLGEIDAAEAAAALQAAAVEDHDEAVGRAAQAALAEVRWLARSMAG